MTHFMQDHSREEPVCLEAGQVSRIELHHTVDWQSAAADHARTGRTKYATDSVDWRDNRIDHEVIDAPDDIEERIVRLRGVYDTLDDKCRMVLDQFYFERKDLATIAAGMGVEEESIRTIKYRCMMKLRGFRKAISGEDMEEA